MHRIKRFVSVISVGLISFIGMPNPVLAAQTAWLVPFDNATVFWNSSGGGANYTNVDDSLFCDGNTTYNYSTTTLDSDMYQVSLSTVPNGSTINKIEIWPCTSANSGSGSSTIKIKWDWNGGGTYYGKRDVQNIGGTTPQDHYLPTVWSGLSLSKTSSSKLDIGVANMNGTNGARISRIRVKIHY